MVDLIFFSFFSLKKMKKMKNNEILNGSWKLFFIFSFFWTFGTPGPKKNLDWTGQSSPVQSNPNPVQSSPVLSCPVQSSPVQTPFCFLTPKICLTPKIFLTPFFFLNNFFGAKNFQKNASLGTVKPRRAIKCSTNEDKILPTQTQLFTLGRNVNNSFWMGRTLSWTMLSKGVQFDAALGFHRPRLVLSNLALLI